MRKILLLTFLLISYILKSQCTGCTITNPTNPNFHFPDNEIVCFTTNTTFNNPTFGSNVKVCIAPGVTVEFVNNIAGVNNVMIYFDVHGTLLLDQTVTTVADLNIHVFNSGNISVSSGNGNLTLNGQQNIILNEGLIELGVLQFGDNTNNNIDNYGNLNVNGNVNMSNSSVTKFRNEGGGLIQLTGNYSNNENSVYINCGTIISNNGFNINGGAVYNTGFFTVGGDINMSGNSSEIHNYGLFTSTGNMNNAPADAIIYNEGKFSINQYQGGNAAFHGPASSSKKGYIEVGSAIQVNNSVIGPNLDFKRTTGVSDPSTVFTNSNPSFLANVTYDCASTNSCSAPLIFLQGVGQGLLFTPLVFFLIAGMPEQYVSNATAVGTSTRFWTTAIGYALMQNLMLFLTLKHSDTLSSEFTDTNPVFYSQWNQIFGANISKLPVNESISMTAGAFKAKINAQAILLSNMEIFTGLFWLALITAFVVLLYHPVKIAVRNIL